MAYDDRADRAAKQWQKELPGLETDDMAMIGRLGEAAHLIATYHAAPFMARYGLKVGEFDVIATLRRSGAPYALTPTELYAATMLSSGGMTNRIDRLEKMGLVARRPNPDDRRGTMVCLTDEGRVLMDRVIRAHVANKARIASSLTPGERAQLSALLAKLIAGVDPESPDFVGGPDIGKEGAAE